MSSFQVQEEIQSFREDQVYVARGNIHQIIFASVWRMFSFFGEEIIGRLWGEKLRSNLEFM